MPLSETTSNPKRRHTDGPTSSRHPATNPGGQFTGTYRRRQPAVDERTFLQSSISYEDFALALADAIRDRWTGTHLISA